MAELRRWRVDYGGKEYVAKAMADGEVLVDGKIAASWGSSLFGLPKSVEFKIEDKNATLRRTGMVSQHFDLIFEGRVYTVKQGRA